MNETALDGLTALRLRQGHTWISRLAVLDGWTPERECEACRMLNACRPDELDVVVEGYRSAMWSAMERTGNVQHVERKAANNAKPAPSPLRKPRGLARHLSHSEGRSAPAAPTKHEARARDSPYVAVDAECEDPYHIRCCESCAHWRRHPESGAGLCLSDPSTVNAMSGRRAWLGAGNALCRCPDFLRARVKS